jgi:hypothetical protein
MSFAQITQETLDLAKQALSQPMAKDATTQGYTVGTGLTGYNLEAPAKSLFPVLSPFRNAIPRVKAPKGAPAANWKAITGINVGNARATTGFGAAGNLVKTSEQDFMAKYQVISLGDSVQYDAQIQAEGFQDLRATAGVNLLYALMEQEDIIMLGGQNYSLGTPGTPALTVANSGGSIGAVNVSVAVAARTMQGYYDGQSTVASPTPATTGALSGTTNKVTATIPAIAGAVVYDWYVGTAGGTLYYAGSTTINQFAFSVLPTQAAAASASGLPQLAAPAKAVTSNGVTTLQAVNTATDCVVDGSGDANSYNGLISTLTGDFVNGAFGRRGTGANTGSYFKSLDGATLTGNNGTISEIDAALQYLWGNAKVSPTKIMMNSIDHVNASNKIIASGGAYTLFRPDAVGERQNVVGGQLVETYLNKAVNGRPVAMETHPWLPQGTIILLTEKLPFPNNKVNNVMEVETLLEYQQIEYATNRQSGNNGGPRYDFEVRAQEVFKNYFPGGMAILSNVANG